jgi:hypothetical protein
MKRYSMATAGSLLAVVIACVLVFAEYTVIPPPSPNATRVIGFNQTYWPTIGAIVTTKNIVITNVVTVYDVPVWTNDSEGILITGVTVQVQVTNRVVVYEYPEMCTRVAPIEMAQLKQAPMWAIGMAGVTSNTTVEQIMDAVIKTGMAMKGYPVTGGELLSNGE